MKKISQILLFAITTSLLITSMVTAQSLPLKTYETVEGKIMGVWPHNDRFNSADKMNELKARWGFEYVLLAAIYNQTHKKFLEEAGFDSLHVAYQIYLPDIALEKEMYLKKLEALGKVWGYYFDEPISREQSYRDFLRLLTFLSDKGLYPHAQFIVGELDERKAKVVLPLVDRITYSGYGGNDKLGLDQAKSWNEWKDFLGEKFSMLWVSSQLDSNEYRTLFKAAKELDFKCIWLYALEPLPTGQEVSNTNYEKFCEAAVEFGFMRIRKKN